VGRAAVCAVLACSLSVALATGPNNQVVPNPAPGGTNTYSSVVGVVDIAGGVINVNGSGTVIGSLVDTNSNQAWLCVLTADHNLPGADTIIFPNYTPGAAPPAARTYPIVKERQVAGLGPGQNPDINVVLVQYGAPDAFYFGVPDKTLATAVGVGQPLAEVGMGRQGTPNFDGNGKLLSITEGAFNTGGTKRYQNNRLHSFIANNSHAGHTDRFGNLYVSNEITYQFNREEKPPGTPNPLFIAGEGTGLRGDSGAPLFNNNTPFDPGGGLPAIVGTDSIAGVEIFGPINQVVDLDLGFAVDVFDYRTNIQTLCAGLLTSVVPEPSAALLIVLVALVAFARRQRVCRVAVTRAA
jgi:hypothetical protein